MGFEIDYEKIDLDKYKEKLKNKKLVPSRRILLDDIDSRFNTLKSEGIENVEKLLKTLKKKSLFVELVNKDSLTEEYLTILLRELKSIQTKTTKLADFNIIPEGLIQKLNEIGIKNTKKLYPYILNKESRLKLAKEIGCELTEIELLAKLSDLSRVQWVNHTFAIVLYEVGCDTLGKLQTSIPENLHTKIVELNKIRNIYKGNIGLNDIVICIEAAREVSIDTDFN